MFAVALMSTSCCKDDPIVPDSPLTVTDMNDTWVSTSYSLNSTTYGDDECASLPAGEYMLITLTENNIADNCDGSELISFVEVLNDGTQLTTSHLGVSFEFNVVDFDREDGILVLYLTDSNQGAPSGGTYTLTNH